MKIAIVGATSQLAQDFIRQSQGLHSFALYARNPGAVTGWATRENLTHVDVSAPLEAYGEHAHDAVVHFIGAGDPARIAKEAESIAQASDHYDNLIVQHLQENPTRRYVFLSSGVVYGSEFSAPATPETPALLSGGDAYTDAKRRTEARHRALAHLPITDLRPFNYVSRHMNLSARYLITDMARSLTSGESLSVMPGSMHRDYLHPADWFQLLNAVLNAPAVNTALDAYSLAPIEKFALLDAMQQAFGLRYHINQSQPDATITGAKTHYYSRNHAAAKLGYVPRYSAQNAVMEEIRALRP